jgi:hypothetical protein
MQESVGLDGDGCKKCRPEKETKLEVEGRPGTAPRELMR